VKTFGRYGSATQDLDEIRTTVRKEMRRVSITMQPPDLTHITEAAIKGLTNSQARCG